MSCRKSYCLFILFLCFAFSVRAQQARFTADTSSGCSPLAVTFTNTSTGFSSNAVYSWDFGNGNTSALKDIAGANYKDEGIYTVTLTVTEESKTSSSSMQITVFKKPVVDFSIDLIKGCAPLPVTFTSNSTPGDGTIAAYTWDFGDGNTQSAGSSLVHEYNIAKIISPSLTVTNSYGCYSTLVKPNLLEINPVVIASFKSNKTVLCNVQDAVGFLNTSAGVGALTYNWDFGDGATSTEAQPKHKYSQPGSYSVTLTATSADGCTSDTVLTNYLNVANFQTDFTIPSVCQNTPATLTDISTPAVTIRKWFINGIRTDTAAALQHTFSLPGTYKVKLANIYETCPDSVVKTVTVQPAPSISGFVARLQNACGAPVSVEFTDTTTGATSAQWDFTGSGTFTGTGQTASYLYTADGTYNVTLKTTGANGCTAQITQPVSVYKDTATIKSSTGDLGCDTKTTVFSAIAEENLTEYNWNFGDGSATSAEATPQHTYTAPGEYEVVLQYITAGGCKGTSKYIIYVYEKPQFDFTSTSGTQICGSNPVNFLVTGQSLSGVYYWNFGDSTDYTAMDPPYSHRYEFDTVYTVSLIIDNNGCRDTVTKTNYITVLPPFPHVASINNTCEGTRGVVTFTERSRKTKQYTWNFGDGSAPYTYTSPVPQVQHEYKSTGVFVASLTGTNGDCSATDSIRVYVLLKQNPSLSAPVTAFCNSDTLRTTVSALELNPATGPDSIGYNLNLVQYSDGSIFNGNTNTISGIGVNSIGVQLSNVDVNQSQIRVITTSEIFGCQDTTNYLPFQALGPVARFSIADNRLCFKTPVVFTDKSKPGRNSPIVKWEWHFGDEEQQTSIRSTSVAHQYADPGTYNATLTVTDAASCTSTTPVDTGNVIVTGPKAAFSVSKDQVLPAEEVWFYNQTNTINTNAADNRYTWHYGDGATNANKLYADSVSHSYQKEGFDTVILIAANVAEQCADTASALVVVRNPNLGFTYTTAYINPESGCPPVIANFVNTSINTTRISWDFGDGNTADNLDNAGHIYEKPGVYKVTLYGYFSDGSIDSIYEMITIQGPYAQLRAVKPFACGAELITLTAASSNSRNFTWDFGDGTLLNNADTFAQHRYLTPGVYTPSLIVSDGNKCKFPFFLNKPIVIDTLHLAISPILAACDSSLLLFTPNIVSEAKELGLQLTYHWNFGTGINKDTANTETGSFIYKRPGAYIISLTGESPYGCTAITSDTIRVQPTPTASIVGPVQICENDSALFKGNATPGVTWNWQFGNGAFSFDQNPPLQVYNTAGLNSVSLVVNDNGCFDTAWHPLLVNANPVVNASPLSATLCQGDSVQLQAHDGNSYRWTPVKYISSAGTATPYVFPDTTTTYFVTVKNEAGCTSVDSISIDVTQHFNVSTPSPLYICPGGIAQLAATGADNYHWLSADVSNADVANPTTSIYASQSYTVVGSDKNGCFTDTATTQVLTAVLPTVNAGADITTFAGTPVSLQATGSDDITTWQWLPKNNLSCDTCASSILTPHADGQYILQATNGSGCVAYDTLLVTILCKLSLVQIPSAFTPNGDGKNDFFSIRGRGIREVKHFAVFDRLGEQLFEQNKLQVGESFANGWDGLYKNKPMPPGTYVFIADLICDTGELFRYKGTVVLIR